MFVEEVIEVSDEEQAKKRIVGKQLSEQYPSTPVQYRMDQGDGYGFFEDWIFGSEGDEQAEVVAEDAQPIGQQIARTYVELIAREAQITARGYPRYEWDMLTTSSMASTRS